MSALPTKMTTAQMLDYFDEKVISAADLDPIAANTDAEKAVWINQALYELGAAVQQHTPRKAFTITNAATDLSDFNIFHINKLYLANGNEVMEYNHTSGIWNQTSAGTITSWYQNGNILYVDPIPTVSQSLIADCVILPEAIDVAVPNEVCTIHPMLHRAVVSLAVARACEATCTEPHQIRVVEKMIADSYGIAKHVQRQIIGHQMPKAVKHWTRKTIS